MSLVSLIPSTIGVFERLHVSNLNNLNMSYLYVLCDIEMHVIEAKRGSPRYLPTVFLTVQIS